MLHMDSKWVTYRMKHISGLRWLLEVSCMEHVVGLYSSTSIISRYRALQSSLALGFVFQNFVTSS